MTVDLKAWREYTDLDFDGLTWPIEEFRKGAARIEELERALEAACELLGRKAPEDVDAAERILRAALKESSA